MYIYIYQPRAQSTSLLLLLSSTTQKEQKNNAKHPNQHTAPKKNKNKMAMQEVNSCIILFTGYVHSSHPPYSRHARLWPPGPEEEEDVGEI